VDLKPLLSLDGAGRFSAVMSTRPLARSAHFLVHYLDPEQLRTRLSTDPEAPSRLRWHAVDDSALMLGLVLPKRHARRSVTRVLLRRKIRSAVAERQDRMPAGGWVVRLRAPIDRSLFASASSEALRLSLHDEMSTLFDDVLRRCRPAAFPEFPASC
jgi:ribonuclease P protein component